MKSAVGPVRLDAAYFAAPGAGWLRVVKYCAAATRVAAAVNFFIDSS